MAIITTISSIDIPELQPYRIFSHKCELKYKGMFVAEGEKIINRLLNSTIEIISFLVTPRTLERFQTQFESERFNNTQIFLAEQSLAETITGYYIHQGIMALCKIPDDTPIEKAISNTQQPCLFIALDGVVNTDNVGGIVRNSVGFGVDLLITGNSSASPYYRRSVRNSMGTVFNLPVFHSENLESDIRELKLTHKFRIIAAHPNGNKELHQINLRENTCIILGNEDKGMSDSLLAICDEKAGIPMMHETDSLNVSNASAVFLYEAIRQRKTNI